MPHPRRGVAREKARRVARARRESSPARDVPEHVSRDARGERRGGKSWGRRVLRTRASEVRLDFSHDFVEERPRARYLARIR